MHDHFGGPPAGEMKSTTLNSLQWSQCSDALWNLYRILLTLVFQRNR
jgi:hypothetical protein